MGIVMNTLIFQMGWWACVVGVGLDHEIPALLFCCALIYFNLTRSIMPITEIKLGLSAWLLGVVIDSVLQYASVINFYGWALGSLSPFWLWMIWILFASTLNTSLALLKKSPLILSAFTGLVFGPITYIAGAKLGAASFDNTFSNIIILGVTWMLTMPALVWMAKHFLIQKYGDPP
jgi:Protein of unknown function (DUF2878)